MYNEPPTGPPLASAAPGGMDIDGFDSGALKPVVGVRVFGKRVPSAAIKLVAIAGLVVYLVWIFTTSVDRYGQANPPAVLQDLPATTTAPPPPAPYVPGMTCTGTVSIAVDNAYVLYVNGFAQRTGHTHYNVGGCDGTSASAVNHAGDPYTGCNWQSVDLIDFTVPSGEAVIGVDALDAGGIGGVQAAAAAATATAAAVWLAAAPC